MAHIPDKGQVLQRYDGEYANRTRGARRKAEEAAAKTTIKLVFPLVFLLFPALFIVILGPGIMEIIRVLQPISQK